MCNFNTIDFKYLFGELKKFPFQRASGILQQKQRVNQLDPLGVHQRDWRMTANPQLWNHGHVLMLISWSSSD